MNLIDHHFESRPFAAGEVIVHRTADVHGLVVVLAQLVGPNGPWDYVVQTYFRDGTRAGTGSWQGPEWMRAADIFDGFVEGWRARADEARALFAAHEAARAA